MADPATPPSAAPATTPAPQTTPATTPAQTSPSPSSAGGAAETVDYRKQHDELKSKYDALMGLVTYDQEAKTAVQRAYNRARGIPETPAADPGEETPETPAAPQAPAGPTHVDLAFNKLATQLGQGDPYKGQQIFEKDYLPEFERVAGVLYGNDADAKVQLLNEYVSLKKGGAAPAQTPADRLRDPNIGFAGERGEAGAAPVTPPDMTGWPAYKRADWYARNQFGVGIDELTRAAMSS